MKKKSTLSKKLTSYSALATVFLIGDKAADAQILYSDVNPDDTTLINNSYLLDLNNDGTTDFKFNLQYDPTWSNQVRVVGLGSNSIMKDEYNFPYSFSGYAYANVLYNGDLIDGLGTFRSQEILVSYTTSNPGTYGNWLGVTGGFLGLKLVVNSNVYYGWARLSVNESGSRMILSDYAVDTVADETIMAGDKCGANYAALMNTTTIPSGSGTLCDGSSIEIATDSIPGFSYQWELNGINITGATNSGYVVNTAGSYSVTVTSNGGCVDSSPAVNISVLPLPAIPVVSQTGNTLNSTAATSYQWFKNGVLVPGATNQSYTPLLPGDYTVQITDANGCSNVSEPYSFVPDAIAEAGNQGITVYAADNRVYVQLSDRKFFGGQVKIFNALGEEIYSSIINAESFQVDLNQEAKGLYLLTVDKGGEKMAKKVVIQ